MFLKHISFLFLLICFFLVSNSKCFAQPSNFITQINKLPEGLRQDFVINHTKELYKKDILKAQREIDDALIFFKGKNIVYATLLSEQATYYTKTKNYLQALKCEQMALDVFDRLNDFEASMTSITKLSRIYIVLNRANEGINLLLKKTKK